MAPLIPFSEMVSDLSDMFTGAHEAFQGLVREADRDAAVAELFEFLVADWLERELFVTPQASRSRTTSGTPAAGSQFGPMIALQTYTRPPETPRPVVTSLTDRLRAARARAAANGRD